MGLVASGVASDEVAGAGVAVVSESAAGVTVVVSGDVEAAGAGEEDDSW